jgi:hypothetical protein
LTLFDKMKEPWPEFFLSIFAAIILSAEYLFLGRASWIYDYGAGLEVLPTYLSLIRSGANFALWHPAIGSGLDRFAFWGTGDSPINLELILFSIFDPWTANGIHMVLQKFFIVFFTALLARQQLGLGRIGAMATGLLHLVLSFFVLGHMFNWTGLPFLLWALYAAASQPRWPIWAIVLGVVTATMVSASQGLPVIMVFVAMWFALVVPTYSFRFLFTFTVFVLTTMLLKAPTLVAVMANIGFSQRAAYSAVDARFPTEILYTESDFLYSDITMWSLTQSLPAIFLVLGLLLVLQLRMDRDGWLQLRPQALQFLRLIAFYFLVDYHAVAFVRAAVIFLLPTATGFQFARFTMAGAALLNSLVVVLTLRLLFHYAPRLAPWRFLLFTIIATAFAWPLVHERVVLSLFLCTAAFSLLPLLILTAGPSLKIRWIPTLRGRMWIAGIGLTLLATFLAVWPKFALFQRMTVDDWGFANYSVQAIDKVTATERQLVRFVSVLPLQPAYAYSQGVEAADGWANIYSRYYRELWLRLLDPVLATSVTTRQVLTPASGTPQDHYIFLGIGILKPEDMHGIPLDSRANLNILSLLNVRYLLSEVPLQSDRLDLVHASTAMPLRYPRDHASGRLAGPPNLTANWDPIDWIQKGREFFESSKRNKFAGKDVYIYRNKCALPRMFFVRQLHAMDDSAGVLDALAAASTLELGTNAWFEAKDGPMASNSDELSLGEIKIRTYTPDRIVLDVSTNGDSFMVISMAWSPYWKARVGGLTRPLVRTDHALMGLSVQPQDRTIVLTYEPPHRILAVLNGVFGPDWESTPPAIHTELGEIPTDAICAQNVRASRTILAPSSTAKERTLDNSRARGVLIHG